MRRRRRRAAPCRQDARPCLFLSLISSSRDPCPSDFNVLTFPSLLSLPLLFSSSARDAEAAFCPCHSDVLTRISCTRSHSGWRRQAEQGTVIGGQKIHIRVAGDYGAGGAGGGRRGDRDRGDGDGPRDRDRERDDRGGYTCVFVCVCVCVCACVYLWVFGVCLCVRDASACLCVTGREDGGGASRLFVCVGGVLGGMGVFVEGWLWPRQNRCGRE